jgi:peptide/nickel transport system permease protein
MTQTELSTQSNQTRPGEGQPATSGFVQLVRYTVVKAITLLVTVAVGLYLTILVANLGGYVDEIFRGRIEESIAGRVMGGWLKGVEEPERTQQMDAYRSAMEQAMGLNEPFLSRTFRWLVRAVTLDLGHGYAGFSILIEPGPVQKMVFDRLPYTLVLVGASNLLLFIGTIWVALALSGRHGGWLDRLNALLQSLTSAPSWIYGVVLIILLAGQLHLLPFPKAYSEPPTELTPSLVKTLLIQMIMPVLAIFISGFFQGIYAWRSYFLIYRDEDYVELSKAKGLTGWAIERRYVLRPALPYVLTSFALMVVGSWQGAIALEKVFYWPGVGPLFLGAVSAFNTPLLLGVVVVFAYLLAITIFLLDIAYALVDPRVRVGSGKPTLRTAPSRLGGRWSRWLGRPPTMPKGPAAPSPALQASSAAPVLSAVLKNISEQEAFAPQPPLRRQEKKKPAAPTAVTSRAKVAATHPLRRSQTSSSFALFWREVARSPSAALGILFILVLLAVSVYAIVRVPYQEAITGWRSQSGEWYRNPDNARPIWFNWFRKDKLPPTIVMNSGDEAWFAEDDSMASLSRRLGNIPTAVGSVSKEVVVGPGAERQVLISYNFDFPYDAFPQEVILYVQARYAEKLPFATLSLVTPDGRQLDLGNLSIAARETQYYLSINKRLQRRYGEGGVIAGLFGDPAQDNARPLQGNYQFLVDALLFEEEANLDVELLVQGRVSGLAGTDNQRRDLMLPLLWGTPVALAFGLLAALGTNLVSMAVSALGVWFGGWVDGLVQRLTELTLVLPTLPLAILVFIMYSKTIWAILGVVILLNIFGSSIKSYRAAFLQMREAPYIEAAQSYGASNRRLILRYLVPRILPTLIPQIVILIPTYVYYEVTLAYLGVSDPYLPTWGKVIHDAVTSSMMVNNAYWALGPIVLLALTSLAFTSVCFALERVLNPRLRER